MVTVLIYLLCRAGVWIQRLLCSYWSWHIHTNPHLGTRTSPWNWNGEVSFGHDSWLWCRHSSVLQELGPPSLWQEAICNRSAGVCKKFKNVVHSRGWGCGARVCGCYWKVAGGGRTWEVYPSWSQLGCFSLLLIRNVLPFSSASPDYGWSLGSCCAPEKPRLQQKGANLGGSCGFLSDQVQSLHPCQISWPNRWVLLHNLPSSNHIKVCPLSLLVLRLPAPVFCCL